MNKKLSKIFFTGLIGGILGSFLFLLLSINGFFIGLDSLRLSGQIIDQATPAPTPVQEDGFWEKIAGEQSLGVVGIQVFKDNRLVKQGSGIVISSDGLILTTSDMAISGAVYQLAYEDKLVKGLANSVDYGLNLFLLKSSSEFSKIADLDTLREYKSGQEVLLISKITEISKPTLVTQKGIVSYVLDNNVVLDVALNNYLSGAGVIDASQKFIGISYLKKGKVNLVRADIIDKFLRDYFDRNK